MYLLSIATALVYAVPTTTGITKLPTDLVLPIVSNIESYRELTAFNITSKIFYPLIRPIFDFSTACQVPSKEVWTNRKIRIGTDRIINMNSCASHLMFYFSLYKEVTLVGLPGSIIAFVSAITSPLQSLITISFIHESLDTQALIKVIDSIKFGSVHLDLSLQIIDQAMVDILAAAMDCRINSVSIIYGITLNPRNMLLPDNIYLNLFEAIPNSDLKRLSIVGRLYSNAFEHLANVIPRSKLTSFEYSIPFLLPSVVGLQALGSALIRTPTMKRVSFKYFPTNTMLLEAMAPGLVSSDIEELEISYGFETPVYLITALPPSMKSLTLVGNNIRATGILNLVTVSARSNLLFLNLMGNRAHLNSTDILEIRDSILDCSLVVLLNDNLIDYNGRTIAKNFAGGRRIII